MGKRLLDKINYYTSIAIMWVLGIRKPTKADIKWTATHVHSDGAVTVFTEVCGVCDVITAGREIFIYDANDLTAIDIIDATDFKALRIFKSLVVDSEVQAIYKNFKWVIDDTQDDEHILGKHVRLRNEDHF